MLNEDSFESEVSPEDPFLALREEIQRGVIDSAMDYIAGASSRDAVGHGSFGRIVLPPRIGKTVIAAHITGRAFKPAGGSMVFLAPRKTLVDQAADELSVHLPGVPVYRSYSGVREEIGEEGVLVTTYDSLQSFVRNGCVPKLIRDARLVFPDEAHHAMTELRRHALRHGFHPDAVRIALTATPDYDEERVLSRDFPDLIHEMTIYEGVQMKLLAPVRASVYEVEVGEGGIGIMAGEYDPRDIERMMTRVPLLQAIREFRYADESKDIPALICCTTRKQAHSVWEYLATHGPSDVPAPGIILGDMSDDSRRRLLKQYENGRLDTLITVGVLIEGWNSPRCKLLIDVSPSLSQVRAAQKYTRPMTKDGSKEARIVVLVPAGMYELPVLPLDVFGPGVEELVEDRSTPRKGHRVEPVQQPKSVWAVLQDSGVKLKSVSVRLRMLENMLIHKIDIQKSIQAIRELVSKDYYGYLSVSPRSYGRFMSSRFRVDEMKVSGRQILRFLGYRPTFKGFRAFMTRYFPKIVADRLLSFHGMEGSAFISSFQNRRHTILRSLDMENEEDLITSQEEMADQSWFSMIEQPSGKLEDVPNEDRSSLDRWHAETVSPYRLLIEKNWKEELARLLDTLSPMEARILCWSFGLDGEEELTFKEIGDKYNLSRTRIWQLKDQALAKIRHQIK